MNMKKHAPSFPGFTHGMGIGGWLTNYKRFNVLPQDWRLPLSPGDYEHFETYITEADVANIASMGMDHIRVGFDQIVVEDTPGVLRERTVKLLDDFVAWCGKHGLHVVLNLHKAVGNYCDIQEDVHLLDDDGLQRCFVNLWIEFERRYADRPDVAFEIMNEIRDVDPEKWNNLAERTLKAIRALNKDRIIVIGTTCWNSVSTLPKLRLYDDPNVVYTFHCYEPFEFTHQRGVLQAAPLYYNRTLFWPDGIERYRDYHKWVWHNDHAYPDRTRMDKDFLRHHLQPAIDFVQAHPDKLLWCGEFGTIRHAPKESRENYMRDLISILKEYGMPFCVWNYLSTPNDGNRFSLVDDDTRKILSPEMGRIIRGEV